MSDQVNARAPPTKPYNRLEIDTGTLRTQYGGITGCRFRRALPLFAPNQMRLKWESGEADFPFTTKPDVHGGSAHEADLSIRWQLSPRLPSPVQKAPFVACRFHLSFIGWERRAGASAGGTGNAGWRGVNLIYKENMQIERFYWVVNEGWWASRKLPPTDGRPWTSDQCSMGGALRVAGTLLTRPPSSTCWSNSAARRIAVTAPPPHSHCKSTLVEVHLTTPVWPIEATAMAHHPDVGHSISNNHNPPPIPPTPTPIPLLMSQ